MASRSDDERVLNQMKKLLIILILLLTTSCAGLNDWDYTLPNGYSVMHINSKKIIISYNGNEKTNAEIRSFVKSFVYDSRYVFAVCSPEKESSDEIYYIIDTMEHNLFGPFENYCDFEEAADSLGVSVPTNWYRTETEPNLLFSVN